jgi:aspartyl protease family protein
MSELPAWVKHTTVWLLLGVALFLGVQAWQARQAAARFVLSNGQLELQRGPDGHYHWPGRLLGNGSEQGVDFLVDTGATSTAIPLKLARQLNLQTVGQVQSQTAGGLVRAELVVVDLVLDGGLRAERLRVTALPNLNAPLLGMDVLGKLHFEQDRGVMKIQLSGPPQR